MKTETVLFIRESTRDGRPKDPEGKKGKIQKAEKAATQVNQAGVEVDV